MSWKIRAIPLLLTLGVGVMFMSTAPAYADSSQVSATEVQVAERAIQLKRIHYAEPEYPSIALQERLSGFVTIEFVVNTKGEPAGLRIIDAQPARVFERSVLLAAKRWRYTPLVVNNVPRERPIRMIVLFETPT